jgi:large conductance mechanosensitive channel
MPPIGQLMSGVDFSNLFVALDGKEYATLEAVQTAGAPAILYGQFINDVVSFIILGFVVFMFVRTYNKMKVEQEAAPTGPSELDILKEIAASLKK